MADLVIYDRRLIDAIEQGKREISSGYSLTCEFAEGGNALWQRNISGNHVAVVQEGRAGPRVGIKDQKGGTTLSLADTVWAKLARLFFTDENITAEESSAALQILGDVTEDPKEEEESMEQATTETTDQGNEELTGMIKALLEATQQNTALLHSLIKQAEPESERGLDALE